MNGQIVMHKPCAVADPHVEAPAAPPSVGDVVATGAGELVIVEVTAVRMAVGPYPTVIDTLEWHPDPDRDVRGLTKSTYSVEDWHASRPVVVRRAADRVPLWFPS